ncbi:MAG: DUF4892 domain-containing protein [Phyllobacteriaceae bacterium]|nr:DUF4892 domain-containing protein [Phyllobacteriaceae bacterium]
MLQTPALAAEPEGSSDYPLIGRYEGSEITGYKRTAFDQVNVIIGPVKRIKEVNGENSIAVSGEHIIINYFGPAGRSSFEVMENFKEKLAASGFEQLFQCEPETCGGKLGANLWSEFAKGDIGGVGMKPRWAKGRYGAFQLKRDEGDVFAALYTQETDAGIQTRVMVVQTTAMQTGKILVLGASELEAALDANGKVALYGIYFDSGKADLKPDSAAQIDAIAAFLKDNPATNVIIAGHTDNEGAFDYNVDLSKRRSEAVLAALVAGGVSKDKLTAFGAGMAAPVSTNATDAGRAQNRRVEIVRR